MHSYDPINWEVEARGSRIQLHTKFEVLLYYMRSYLKSTIIIISNKNNNNNNNAMVADNPTENSGLHSLLVSQSVQCSTDAQVLCVLPVDSADRHPRVILASLVCVTC